MKKIALLLLLMITFSSCKSSKKIVTTKSKSVKIDSRPIVPNSDPLPSKSGTLSDINYTSSEANELADRIVDYAFKFDGVRYKPGGTTKKGMDCSGLVVTAFESENISLPRISRDIALTGDWIDLKKVTKGDLLFFATRKNSRTISHVGIVTTARDGFVEFIHASTSSGVIVSNLAEKYWYFAFVQARRVL